MTCLGLLAVLAATLCLASAAAASPRHAAKVQLGAKLYFDATLSEPSGQACADCHQPFAGYADPEQGHPVSEGVIEGRFGGRNAPSAAYMGKSPVLHQADGVWTGGAFWDGRASGWTDRRPLIEQAKGPFLNPGEMNNAAKAQVVRDVKRSGYAPPLQAGVRLGRVRGHGQGVPLRGRRHRRVRAVGLRQHLLVSLRRLRAGREEDPDGAGKGGSRAVQRQGALQPVSPERSG